MPINRALYDCLINQKIEITVGAEKQFGDAFRHAGVRIDQRVGKVNTCCTYVARNFYVDLAYFCGLCMGGPA